MRYCIDGDTRSRDLLAILRLSGSGDLIDLEVDFTIDMAQNGSHINGNHSSSLYRPMQARPHASLSDFEVSSVFIPGFKTFRRPYVQQRLSMFRSKQKLEDQ